MSSLIALNADDIYSRHAAKENKTCGIIFMIGSERHLGQGLALSTLQTFMHNAPSGVVRFLVGSVVKLM